MAKRKNPEERSATTQPQPGQAPAQPTGGEVYQRTQKPVKMTGPARLGDDVEETPVTEEDAAEMEGLLSTASAYYDRLLETADRLSDQASEAYDSSRLMVRDHPGTTVLGAFVVGVVVGMLLGRQ